MITVSGALVKKIVDSDNGIFSPVVKVEYYDTPFSVPSWGFKTVYYDNHNQSTQDFTEEKVTFVGRDQALSHSWGEGGAAQVPNGHDMLIRWLGYFKADVTGIHKFYMSVDDGGRFYVGTGAARNTVIPSGLGAADLLDVQPTDVGEDATIVNDSWNRRNNIVTFSGWVDLTADTWYPIRLDYFNDTGSTVRYSDALLRYERPDSSVKRIVSAGVVNYPNEVEWASADSAVMLGSSTPEAYGELLDVVSVDIDRKTNSVGQAKIKLPLSKASYRPVRERKGHYKHVESQFVIRPGRLVDVSAGFQTKCLHFNASTETCDLGVPHETDGGQFLPNLCSQVNPICPFQDPMPGDFVKRFRGRIVSVEVERGETKSFLVLHCEDNMYYLRKAISENFPNHASYAAFDYVGLPSTPTRPDGVGMPTAYDSFFLNEAFQDVCVKAGVDPSYLYQSETLLASGGNNDVLFVTGRPTVQGEQIQLARAERYGNALYSGAPNDPLSDSEYVWKQGFGEPMIDIASSMAENYGFFIGADVNGNMLLQTRNTPVFFATSGIDTPSNWHQMPDTRAAAGDYVFASGQSGHAVLPVQGSKVSLYYATERPVSADTWSVLHNEGLVTEGFEHGEYEAQEVERPFGILGQSFAVGYDRVEGETWNWNDLSEAEPHINIVTHGQCWCVFRPKYEFTLDAIRFRYQGGDFSSGFWNWAYDMKCDIYIGEFTASDDSESVEAKQLVDIAWDSAPTQVGTDVDINELFVADPHGEWREFETVVSDFVLTSGVEYAIKFESKLFVNTGGGSTEWTVARHVTELENNRYFREYCKNGFPWTNYSHLGGTRIASDASPDPVDYRMLWTSNIGILGDITWNHGTQSWDQNYMRNHRRTFVDIGVYDKDGVEENDTHVMIEDLDGDIVYEARHANNFPLPYGRVDYRFSSDGIDPVLGFNPNIWTIPASVFSPPIPEMGTLTPESNTFTVLVSGTQLRLEGISVATEKSTAPKFAFSTVDNVFDLGVENATEDIRNDIVVVGNLKGMVVDPETNKISNPNNPTFDYVYSRAVDLGSIGQLGPENSLGMRVPFVIYEPNIRDQEHADYLSYAVLNRHRKVQNLVSWDGIAVPFLDLEDAVQIADETQFSSIGQNIQWIEGISESITSEDYSMSLDSTPLPPWPSFTPKPPPDIDNFALDGIPQVIVGVSMTDTNDVGRADLLASPHDTNYDPYEAEGASPNSDSSNGHPPVKLKCEFSMLVNGSLRVAIKQVDIDNTDTPNDRIIAWLIGNETDVGDRVLERRDWGTYEVEWDGTDFLGNSRNPSQGTAEEIQTALDGIYVRDARYYLYFEVESSDQEDHDTKGAPREYSTLHLPTDGDDDTPLNPSNADLGTSYPGNPTNVKAQVWKTEIGIVTAVNIKGNCDVNTDLGKWAFPSASQIKGKQFTSLDDNLEVWLEPPGSNYFKNRDIRYEIKIEEGSCLVMPPEEIIRYDPPGTPAEDDYYVGANADARWVAAPGGPVTQYRITASVLAADSGFSSADEGTNDETGFHKYPIFMRNENNGEIPGVPGLDRLDDFVKLNDFETRVRFNPMRYGLYFNQVPSHYFGIKNDAKFKHVTIEYLGDLYTVSVGFKDFQVCYMARWINVYFRGYDRSGRPLSSLTTWSHHKGFGKIDPTDPSAHRGWFAYRCIWVPYGSNDMSGSQVHRYMDWPDPENWTNATDYNNDSVKRIAVGGYTTTKDADLPTPTDIEHHTIFCMHHASPDGHSGHLNNISSISEFRDDFGTWGFYAWPVWMFWPANPGDTNWASRENDPDGASDFMDDPPTETIRG